MLNKKIFDDYPQVDTIITRRIFEDQSKRNDIAETVPPCPWCHTDKHIQPAGQLRTFYCRKCCREFDDSEDGTIGYGRPSKRLEQEERKKETLRQRNKRVAEMWR